LNAPNFTITGDLGLPGFTRVPPPYGTPRDAARAIRATLAQVHSDERLAAAEAARQLQRTQWRQRLMVMAIGVVCTVIAALIGSNTGQRRQPPPRVDHAPALAQSTVPSVPAKVISAETAALEPAARHVMTDTLAPLAAKTAKPRMAARPVGRAVASAAPATSTSNASEAIDEPYRATMETSPITSGYVAPGTPVRIELQRHTRLTD